MHTFNDLGELLKEILQKLQNIEGTITDEKERLSKAGSNLSLETQKISINPSGGITANIPSDTKNPMDIEGILQEIGTIEKAIHKLSCLIKLGSIAIPPISI